MRTYEVVGTRPVGGHAQGETFEADLAPHEEALLVEAGHIRRVKKSEQPPAEAAKK